MNRRCPRSAPAQPGDSGRSLSGGRRPSSRARTACYNSPTLSHVVRRFLWQRSERQQTSNIGKTWVLKHCGLANWLWLALVERPAADRIAAVGDILEAT